ncbi:unnamed protein product, partial [Sphacelaria rigidula]
AGVCPGHQVRLYTLGAVLPKSALKRQSRSCWPQGLATRCYGRVQASSLWMTVENGHENIVRMLVDAGVVVRGGPAVIPGEMCRASAKRQARILDMLLGVQGETRKKYWTRQLAENTPILHHATMHASLATVHICLVAGADETSINGTGLRASKTYGNEPPAKHPESSEAETNHRSNA